MKEKLSSNNSGNITHNNYLTIKEAADFSGKSHHTIRGLVKKKRLVTIRESKGNSKITIVMVDKDSLCEYYNLGNERGINPDHVNNTDTNNSDVSGLKETILLLKDQVSSLGKQVDNKDSQINQKDQQLNAKDTQMEKLINTNMALNSHVLKLKSGDEFENVEIPVPAKKKGFFSWLKKGDD